MASKGCGPNHRGKCYSTSCNFSNVSLFMPSHTFHTLLSCVHVHCLSVTVTVKQVASYCSRLISCFWPHDCTESFIVHVTHGTELQTFYYFRQLGLYLYWLTPGIVEGQPDMLSMTLLHGIHFTQAKVFLKCCWKDDSTCLASNLGICSSVATNMAIASPWCCVSKTISYRSDY